MSTATGNRWTEPEWATRFLAERASIPHAVEGYGAVMELVPASVACVLDLGTGDGATLAMVLDAHPEASGVGVDFNAEMLARARSRFGDGVDIVEHDLSETLPELGTFDLVVSSFAIHHLTPARQRALYGEVFAMLSPGGRFVNLEHVDSPTLALHHEFLAALGKAPADDDPSNQLVRLDAQLAALREIGFIDVDCFWKWRELALLSGTVPA